MLTNTCWLVSSSGQPCFKPCTIFTVILLKWVYYHIINTSPHVLQKTLQWLSLSPIPYIPKSLAQSMKALSPKLAWQFQLPMALNTLTEPNCQHILRWTCLHTFGPWRMLPTPCNILPILTLVCLANTAIRYSGLISDTFSLGCYSSL